MSTAGARPLLFSLEIQEFYPKFTHISANLGLIAKMSYAHQKKRREVYFYNWVGKNFVFKFWIKKVVEKKLFVKLRKNIGSYTILKVS